MPLNIVVGILALLVALTCYSIAVWGAFRKKSVGRSQLRASVGWGSVFDVLATGMMAILPIGGLDLRPGAPLLHTVLALRRHASAMFAVALRRLVRVARPGRMARAALR